jgi:hypothetical protein
MVYKPRYSKPAEDLHALSKVSVFNTGSSGGSCGVKYNGTCVGDTPKVDIDITHQYTGAGDDLGTITRITVTGKNLSTSSGSSGSITITPADYSTDYSNGGSLEIDLCGVISTYNNCKVVSVAYNRTPDNWFNTVDYTVVFESHSNNSSGSGSSGSSLIVSQSDSWSAEPLEDSFPSSFGFSVSGSNNLGTTPSSSGSWKNKGSRYRVTHRVSAKAVNPTSPGDAWKDAKDWVCSKFGSGTYYTGNTAYNKLTSISYDEKEGSYERTDTWTETDQGSFYQDLTVEVSNDSTGLQTVRLQGSYQNLTSGRLGTCSSGVISSGSRGNMWSDNFSSQYFYSIAKHFGGSGLNSTPVSTTIGRDISKGTITFSYEYNDRPFFLCSSGACPDLISENITINDTEGKLPVFSENFVIGRTLGPVIQDLGTIQSFKKDLNIEFVIALTGSSIVYSLPSTADTAVTNLIDRVKPGTGTIAKKTADNSNWSPTEGRYSRSISWTYQYCDASSSGFTNKKW